MSLIAKESPINVVNRACRIITLIDDSKAIRSPTGSLLGESRTRCCGPAMAPLSNLRVFFRHGVPVDHVPPAGMIGRGLFVQLAVTEGCLSPDDLQQFNATVGVSVGLGQSLSRLRAPSQLQSLGRARQIAMASDVEFQPYRNSGLLVGDGVPHHLNQTEILGGLVAYEDGITTPLMGDAFREGTSPHFITHRGTEAFFDVYRPATTTGVMYPLEEGWLVGDRPTFSQYNRALYSSLQEAGVSPDRALRMVIEAKAEQVGAGFRGADRLPDLPRRMGQKGGS